MRQILYTAFSSYIGDDPLNLGILAPTSEGKTYAITESLQYFPDEDIMYVGQMSPKVLVRQKGILIDKKSGESLYDKVEKLRTRSRELKKKKRATKDQNEIDGLDEEIEKIDEDIRKMHDNSKTLIDLRGKILVFLEPPQYELWELLKPILSHDKKEIENNLVDKVNDAYSFEILQEHFLAITAIKEGQRRLWELSDKEQDPYKSAEIITQALNSYPFLTTYYLNIKKVMSQHKSVRIQKNTIPV